MKSLKKKLKEWIKRYRLSEIISYTLAIWWWYIIFKVYKKLLYFMNSCYDLR